MLLSVSQIELHTCGPTCNDAVLVAFAVSENVAIVVRGIGVAAGRIDETVSPSAVLLTVFLFNLSGNLYDDHNRI